jgi:hypothetical protein
MLKTLSDYRDEAALDFAIERANWRIMTNKKIVKKAAKKSVKLVKKTRKS